MVSHHSRVGGGESALVQSFAVSTDAAAVISAPCGTLAAVAHPRSRRRVSPHKQVGFSLDLFPAHTHHVVTRVLVLS